MKIGFFLSVLVCGMVGTSAWADGIPQLPLRMVVWENDNGIGKHYNTMTPEGKKKVEEYLMIAPPFAKLLKTKIEAEINQIRQKVVQTGEAFKKSGRAFDPSVNYALLVEYHLDGRIDPSYPSKLRYSNLIFAASPCLGVDIAVTPDDRGTHIDESVKYFIAQVLQNLANCEAAAGSLDGWSKYQQKVKSQNKNAPQSM